MQLISSLKKLNIEPRTLIIEHFNSKEQLCA